MKKILSTIAMIAAAATMFTGCFNLDEEAFSEVVQKDFTPSEQDVAALTASAYTPLAAWFAWYGIFDSLEEPADVVITPVRPNGWEDGGTYIRMHKHTWDSQQGQPGALWSYCYEGINNANRVLSQVESGELETGDEKEAITAELKSIRALYYSILLDCFGNVPLVTSWSNDIPTQSTREEVFNFVVSELTSAIDSGLLKTEKSATTYTSMNVWSARMCLMRVYLNAKVYVGKEMWQEAYNQANEIIEKGPYSLSSDYSDNFKVELDASNSEVILAIPYDSKISTGGYVFCQNKKWYPPVARNYWGCSWGTWGGSCANPQFVDSYQEGDSRKEKTWMYGPMKKGDEVIWTNLNYLPSIDGQNGSVMTSIDFGLRQQKYEIDLETDNYFGNDVPYFRLAEAYLTRAECSLRMNKNTDQAVSDVNAVRTRSASAVTLADLQGDTKMVYGLVPWGALTTEMYNECNITHDWSAYTEELESSQTPVQSGYDAQKVELGGLYDEWGWEFALEGLRRQQMIRFGTFSTKNWFNHEAQFTDGHTAIFPIPKDAMDTNGNLKQNPGY